MLVQLLNAVELATKGEYQGTAKVEIRVDSSRLKVNGARVIWPTTEDLPLRTGANKTVVVFSNLTRYAALYLKLEGG